MGEDGRAVEEDGDGGAAELDGEAPPVVGASGEEGLRLADVLAVAPLDELERGVLGAGGGECPGDAPEVVAVAVGEDESGGGVSGAEGDGGGVVMPVGLSGDDDGLLGVAVGVSVEGEGVG